MRPPLRADDFFAAVFRIPPDIPRPPRDVPPAPLDDRRPPDEALRLLLPADFLATVLRLRLVPVFFAADLRPPPAPEVFFAADLRPPPAPEVFFAADLRPRPAPEVFFAADLRPPVDAPRPVLDPSRPVLLDGLRPRLELAAFLPPDRLPLELDDPRALELDDL